MPDVDDFSDTSSSIGSSVEYDGEKDRKRRKKSRRHRGDSDDRRRRRHRSSDRSDKKKKKKKRRHKKSSKDKKKKDRKRRTHDDSSDESSSRDSDGNSDSDSEYSRHRRHKRSKKERKRRRKETTVDDDEEREESRSNAHDVNNNKRADIRAQNLARALHQMLDGRRDFAPELPLILIRLAGGTMFDLSQVTDPGISHGLKSVFGALESFGVTQQPSSGMWMFRNPPGATRRDELVLLRVIRSLLDEVGLTMDGVERFERQPPRSAEETGPRGRRVAAEPSEGGLDPGERRTVKEATLKLLEKFLKKDATLGTQLATLCKTIVEGESVCLDGLPDEELKTALESLFETCGLEKSEIEQDDDDDDDDDDDGDDEDDSDNSPMMGYGIPGSSDSDSDAVQIKLAIIMAACREGPPKRTSIGPMRRPMTEAEEQVANILYASNENKEEDEDEGPLLPGEARKARGPALSLDTIRAQAEHRELQLKATAAGVDMPAETGGREEWMILPGQHDFLSAIKSGQAIKSRGFQNKKSRDADKNTPTIHPAVQAEMDAIMEAHQDARGPSLADLHRSKIAQEKELAARASNGKKEWKWNRDKDLDAGRRVDKDALGMILGGAKDDLKSKFAGGFNR